MKKLIAGTVAGVWSMMLATSGYAQQEQDTLTVVEKIDSEAVYIDVKVNPATKGQIHVYLYKPCENVTLKVVDADGNEISDEMHVVRASRRNRITLDCGTEAKGNCRVVMIDDKKGMVTAMKSFVLK